MESGPSTGLAYLNHVSHHIFIGVAPVPGRVAPLRQLMLTQMCKQMQFRGQAPGIFTFLAERGIESTYFSAQFVCTLLLSRSKGFRFQKIVEGRLGPHTPQPELVMI